MRVRSSGTDQQVDSSAKRLDTQCSGIDPAPGVAKARDLRDSLHRSHRDPPWCTGSAHNNCESCPVMCGFPWKEQRPRPSDREHDRTIAPKASLHRSQRPANLPQPIGLPPTSAAIVSLMQMPIGSSCNLRANTRRFGTRGETCRKGLCIPECKAAGAGARFHHRKTIRRRVRSNLGGR